MSKIVTEPKFAQVIMTPAMESKSPIKNDISLAAQHHAPGSAQLHKLQTHVQASTHPSPIHRLPAELLQTIFLSLFLPLMKKHLRKSQPSGKSHIYPTLPLLLAHVCVSWRAVAYATPELWSSVEIEIADDDFLQHPPSKILEDWLSRSGTSPITISFYALSDYSDNKACLETLALFSKRWVDVYFRMKGELLETFTSLHSSDIPLLQAFDIHDELTFLDNISINKPTFLHYAPALHTIGTSARTMPVLPLPNTQLTTLILRNSPVFHAMVMLERLPHIQRLFLTFNGSTFVTPSWTTVTKEQPYLQQLKIDVNAIPLLQSFTFPSLCQADISGDQQPVVITLLFMICSTPSLFAPAVTYFISLSDPW